MLITRRLHGEFVWAREEAEVWNFQRDERGQSARTGARNLRSVGGARDGSVRSVQCRRRAREVFILPLPNGRWRLGGSSCRDLFDGQIMRDAVWGVTHSSAADTSIRDPSVRTPSRAGAFAASSDGLGVLVDTGLGVMPQADATSSLRDPRRCALRQVLRRTPAQRAWS